MLAKKLKEARKGLGMSRNGIRMHVEGKPIGIPQRKKEAHRNERKLAGLKGSHGIYKLVVLKMIESRKPEG